MSLSPHRDPEGFDPALSDAADLLRTTLAETADRVPVPRVPSFSWEVARPARRPLLRRAVVGLVPAAAAAAVAGTLLLTSGTPAVTGGPGPAPTDVAPAALLAPGATAPMGPGQYFYSRVTTVVPDGRPGVVVETWQPQRASDEWTRRVTQLGPDKTPIGPSWVTTAACGRFPAGPGVFLAPDSASACDGPGSWSRPTPAFLASLPTDPAALYASLHAYVEDQYRDSAADRRLDFSAPNLAFLTVTTVLGVGTDSAGLSQTFSAALERAVARIPGVVVRQDVANLAGVRGTAYEIHAPNGAVAGPVLFDADGNYIGTPDMSVVVGAADSPGDVPAGTGTD